MFRLWPNRTADGTPGRPSAGGPAEAPQWGELKRRIHRRLAELGIQVPIEFDLNDFVAQLERARGRRIVLHRFHQTPGADTVCGYTIMWPSYDAVCYQGSLSGRSGAHNAVHELGHLVLEHESGLGPGWSTTSPTGGMDEAEEWEADAFAAVILGRDDEPLPSWSARRMREQAAFRVHDAFR